MALAIPGTHHTFFPSFAAWPTSCAGGCASAGTNSGSSDNKPSLHQPGERFRLELIQAYRHYVIPDSRTACWNSFGELGAFGRPW